MRTFDSGATRDDDADKVDFAGFLSPVALEAYAQYMHRHRQQADGTLRASNNWRRGMPMDTFVKSGWRHFFAWWKAHDEGRLDEEAVCGLLFNLFGYLDGIRRGRGTSE